MGSIETDIINALSHSGIPALATYGIAFLFGAFVKWRKHISSSSSDAASKLMDENRMYKLLVEDKDKELTATKTRLEIAEQILQNRSPQLDKFIADVRHKLEIPEGQ